MVHDPTGLRLILFIIFLDHYPRTMRTPGTVPKLGKFGFLSLILGGILPGSSICLEGGVVRLSGNNDKLAFTEAHSPPCAPYSLRVGSPM